MANNTERIGIHHCGTIAEKNKWMFREQPVNDIGIDAHIEYIDDSNKPKQLLALQIKSGPSWFGETKNGCIVFRHIDERQYNYWIANPLPCILVLYNPTDDKCIWQILSKNTIKSTQGGNYYVEVPLSNVFLDDKSNEKLLKITNLPEYVVNYNFLLSQITFMEIIQKGGTVKLHSQEWVNKSSGRGDTELIVDDGNGIKRYLYPYWFPYTPYTEVFPKLFPWATFSADEDFFEEQDRQLWRQLHCFYDKEEDEYIVVGDAFEVFRKKLSPMRYVNHSNEVAEYMMVLGLNNLGKSFLTTNAFISKKIPYSEARPEKDND